MDTARHPISFIATNNAEAAIPFYRDVLGLDLVEQSAFALVFFDGSHMLRVQILPGFSPASHTTHGWHVADIDVDIATLAGKGVEFMQFDAMTQTPSGVWATPDGHKVAWFKDPCGNRLSLTQFS